MPLICTGVLHVAESAARAWEEAAPGIAYLEEGIRGELHEELRFEHFAHWARLPGLSHERAMASLELFAGEVVPRVMRPASPLRTPGASRQASEPAVSPWSRHQF